MADLSPIQNLLDDIKNAIYGEQVRTAIHDSIARCYTDVDDSKTISASAADNANAAASAAELATSRANNASVSATTAADAANAAASNASSATTDASNAAISANNAATNANAARTAADAAASSANAAATSANRAASNADAATTSATRATENANSATKSATQAAASAQEATADATTAINDCNEARYNATVATTSATAAASRANSASSMIENLSITSENVSPDTPASARISDVDGHKNIHFLLRQGTTGAPYLIKGRAYATVEELESSITSPAIGDQYNVGTAAPYNIYRWTGSTWEDQGKIGINFQNLTDAEIDSIWNGTAVSSTSSKYIDHSGLFHLIVDRIKAAFTTKVDKVEGKGLSTNDFTNEYVSQISTHDSQLSSLANLKVDKVTGKGLSTNDFTNEYKNLVNRVNSLAGTDTLETDAQTLSGAVNEVNTLANSKLDSTYIPIRVQQSAISYLPVTINNPAIRSDMAIVHYEFDRPAAFNSDITWTTADGSLTLSGTIVDGMTTSADIILART